MPGHQKIKHIIYTSVLKPFASNVLRKHLNFYNTTFNKGSQMVTVSVSGFSNQMYLPCKHTKFYNINWKRSRTPLTKILEHRWIPYELVGYQIMDSYCDLESNVSRRLVEEHIAQWTLALCHGCCYSWSTEMPSDSLHLMLLHKQPFETTNACHAATKLFMCTITNNTTKR